MTTRKYAPWADPDTEASLVGAMLLSAKAIDAALTAGVTASMFIVPACGLTFDAIVDLYATGTAVDPVIAANELNRRGQLADVGGTPTLIEMQSGTSAISSAPAYARIVVDYAHERRINTELESTLNGRRSEWRRVIEELLVEVDGWHAGGNTLPIADLEAVMAGEVDAVIPTVAPRDDGATCLLYGPGVNWLSGEPGEGKSWLALWWVVQTLRDGQCALYVDYEGTEQGVVSRLTTLGVTDVSKLTYMRIVDPWSAGSLAELRALVDVKRFAIVVIDAVAGAMEAEGLDPESNRDVERWCALTPTMFQQAGAAVVCVDHVAKDRQTRGRWMIGAQRKMARADAAFSLEMFERAGVGSLGRGKLLVAKDRYGALGEHQSGRAVAEVVLASEPNTDGGYDMTVGVGPPTGGIGVAGQPTGPTWYMERVSRVLELAPLGVRDIRKAVGRQPKYVDLAIKALVDANYIEQVQRPGKLKPYRSLMIYRQEETPPTSERFYSEDDPGPDDPLF